MKKPSKRYSFGRTRDKKVADKLTAAVKRAGHPHTNSSLVTKLIVECKCGIIKH